jgi:hypothetical protein
VARTKLLLGLPRIERDGVRVEVDTRKALALAAYLARTAQPHSWNTLAALLWPDALAKGCDTLVTIGAFNRSIPDRLRRIWGCAA